MSEDYQERQQTNARRQTLTLPVVPIAEEEQQGGLARRLSTSINVQHRLSTVSQIYLPHGDEYRSHHRVPPAGAEFQQQFVFSRVEDPDGHVYQRRLSVISEGYNPIEDEENERTSVINEDLVETKSIKRRRRILFIMEPIIVGLILLPILVLFWECGWNLVWILLKAANGYSWTSQLDEITEQEITNYSTHSLLIPYFIAQILLLILYLGQDLFYNVLKRQNRIVAIVLLKCHIFLLASIYIVQWEMLWTVWDQYTPHEWYFELVLSLTSLSALIVFIGHLSDLVYAPFLVSYDSIEYCVQFGCPLLTRNMNPWKIHLINYVLYEIIISNIAVMAWRGFYNFLDKFMYPDELDKSAWICLLIGYLLYFPLMYFQNYLEYLNLKFEFWTFVSINFPQLYRNIRHLFAFLSCLFLWRGFWILYDSHIVIFELHYRTYLLLYLLSFFFLALIQTSSSTNGPMSNMEDDNRFFPLYPNCYVSIVVRKFSRPSSFQWKTIGQKIKSLEFFL